MPISGQNISLYCCCCFLVIDENVHTLGKVEANARFPHGKTQYLHMIKKVIPFFF